MTNHKSRKIFCSHLPYTNDIGMIQEERRISELFPKYKPLIITQNPEKYPNLTVLPLFPAFPALPNHLIGKLSNRQIV